MDRNQKSALLGELQERLRKAGILIVCQATALNSHKTRELRRAIRRAGGELKVAKNTIVRIAIDGTAFAGLTPFLQGPTRLVFGYGDPVAVAKVLVQFAREESERVQVRAAITSGKLLDAQAVDELAKLPERPVLLGRLLALMQTPASLLVRLLQEPGTQVVRVLSQRSEQLRTG